MTTTDTAEVADTDRYAAFLEDVAHAFRDVDDMPTPVGMAINGEPNLDIYPLLSYSDNEGNARLLRSIADRTGGTLDLGDDGYVSVVIPLPTGRLRLKVSKHQCAVQRPAVVETTTWVMADEAAEQVSA